MFDRIAKRIERSGGAKFYDQAELTQTRQKVVKSAVVMANELKADAIRSLRGMVAWRVMPAGCVRTLHGLWPVPRDAVARGLSLSWGVKPMVIPFDLINPQNTIETALKLLIEQGLLKKGRRW